MEFKIGSKVKIQRSDGHFVLATVQSNSSDFIEVCWPVSNNLSAFKKVYKRRFIEPVTIQNTQSYNYKLIMIAILFGLFFLFLVVLIVLFVASVFYNQEESEKAQYFIF